MKERLSSLLDGDVEPAQSAPLFDALRQDAELRGQWEAYCLVGDALRGEHDHSPGFVSRVMAELDAEPTLLAPVARKSSLPFIGRPAMAVAASVMGVVAVGLVAFTMYPASTDGLPASGVVATAPAAAQLASVQPAAANVAGDDAHRHYMFAHQAMSGGPIPGVVHYVRTVSDRPGEQR